MDPESRRIVRALLVVLLMAALAFAASLFVPYNVTFDATITDLEGNASLLIPNRRPRELTPNPSDPIPLQLEQSLRLDPGSRATLIFSINGGQMVADGPATIRLAESQRRATTYGHLRERGEYTLIIEQDGGTARYYFDNADPPLDQSDITIRVERDTTTTTTLREPCWLAGISASGDRVSQPITCR